MAFSILERTSAILLVSWFMVCQREVTGQNGTYGRQGIWPCGIPKLSPGKVSSIPFQPFVPSLLPPSSSTSAVPSPRSFASVPQSGSLTFSSCFFLPSWTSWASLHPGHLYLPCLLSCSWSLTPRHSFGSCFGSCFVRGERR